MFSFSAVTFSESSRRPTMMIHAGPWSRSVAFALPAFEATLTAWLGERLGSVKLMVALMLSPAMVASSIAGIPARVTGSSR